MQKCPVCNGRVGKTADGYKCISPACGALQREGEEGVMCKCGEPMNYVGLNSYGEPNYSCSACGSRTKL